MLLALRYADTDLASARAGMTRYPQTMINVRVEQAPDLNAHPDIAQAVAEVEGILGDRGRVLLRPSGTEPVVRVMIEGEDAEEVARLCEELAAKVAKILA